MAVPAVFLSSVIGGFEEVRAQAADAITQMGMYPVLSERKAADPQAPRSALLEEVGDAEIYMLLLGEHYGQPGPGGTSPTEDEYDEAMRRNRPILVLARNGDMEPRQRQFLDRIKGDWGEGVLYGTFNGPEDVGPAVAAALGRYQTGVVEDGPRAQQRAATLAAGEDRSGTMSSGLEGRVAMAPLREAELLDALSLEDPTLGDALAGEMRSGGLVPQQIGIKAQVSAGGICLEGSEPDEWTTPLASIGPDGAIVVVGSVAAQGNFGSQLVDPSKLDALIRNAGRFAQSAWDRLDKRGEIGRVAVVAAIPDAQYKGYGAVSGSSMSMSTSLPRTVIAPDPALVVPRNQLADQELARRIEAAIRRVFTDAGAVHG
jgi:Domain of unknown function (DUF4062)